MRHVLPAFFICIGCAPKPDVPLPRDSAAQVGDTGPDVLPSGTCVSSWHPDQDADGYGDDAQSVVSCAPPFDWISTGGDCDDQRADRNPDVQERCNGLDDDCDGEVDEGFGGAFRRWYPDLDGDGWGRDDGARWLCEGGERQVTRPGDCHDGDPEVHAGAREPCNGLDDDCDGAVDEGCGGTCGDGIKGGAFEACDGDDARTCPGSCSAHCACPSGQPGTLRIHMIDVGQGDAILVISPDGFVMLVDAGPGSACDDLGWYLEAHGVQAIDYTVVSHQHADHHGSMDTVLTEHPEVVAAFDNGGWFSGSNDQAYFDAAWGRRVPLRPGDRPDLGPLLDVDVLHSYADAGNENDNSIVLRVTYGDFTMLLGGDCEHGCERGLDLSGVDVYKVHHHGSSDSSSESLLDIMEPQVALIPVGLDNAYGHPDRSTLVRLEARGVDVLRTDLDGDITVETDGETFDVAGVGYTSAPAQSSE